MLAASRQTFVNACVLLAKEDAVLELSKGLFDIIDVLVKQNECIRVAVPLCNTGINATISTSSCFFIAGVRKPFYLQDISH